MFDALRQVTQGLAHRLAAATGRKVTGEIVADFPPRPPAAADPRAPLIFGLDLGQAQDYSALACVEQLRNEDGAQEYAVRHLHRWPLGTPYTAPEGKANGIAEDLAGLIADAGRPVVLVLDATGCGRPVVDLLRKYRLGARLVPVTITAGSQTTLQSGWWHAPKRDLAGAVAVGLERRTLHVAPGLPLVKTLTKELLTFRVKVTTSGNETFEAWRERDHDDLVLAVALAVWFGSRPQRRLTADNIFC
jgi:hypothetical protein